MINILGGVDSDSHLPLVEMAKSMYGSKMAVYLHLYGKEAKPGRKIGHITITGLVANIAELEDFALPLVNMASNIRHERLQARSKALRPEQAVSKPPTPLVLVTMGSDSDLPVLKAGLDILTQFGVPWEADITSAHRTPSKMGEVATKAAARGIKVIIAAAGGAAHLPGMLSAYTPLPVIGVPVKATHLGGLDSLLSIVQMPVSYPPLDLTPSFACHLASRLTEHSGVSRPPRWGSTTPPTRRFSLSGSWAPSSLRSRRR